MHLKGKFLNQRGLYKADRIGSMRKKKRERKKKKKNQVQEEMEPGKMIRFRWREWNIPSCSQKDNFLQRKLHKFLVTWISRELFLPKFSAGKQMRFGQLQSHPRSCGKYELHILYKLNSSINTFPAKTNYQRNQRVKWWRSFIRRKYKAEISLRMANRAVFMHPSIQRLPVEHLWHASL